ncbi:MAG: hypothetical protein AN486_23015 [Anabaena sp. AL93]|nr:MAG: hypothetical protein AN486_23015 [Anabaena sp. AL93]
MVAFTAFVSVLMIFSAQPVQAAPVKRIFENPPLLELHKQTIPTTRSLANQDELGITPYSGPNSVSKQTIPTTRSLANPKTKLDVPVEFDLSVKYTSGEIYNPTTNKNDQVNLRSYVGIGTSTKTPYVGPTIEVKPGNTVQINLKNELPQSFSPRCQDLRQPGNENEPNCNNHNRTNLHSHGLWISPTGNSDNVLSVIDPTVTFQYEYNIPSDHPAGTFWYHPHLHGSTALQVASGLSGALIVRGDRLPSKNANGDIDILLNKADIKEQILLFQQIQYACLDENNKVKWDCQPTETGEIESYKGLFSPSSWTTSKRYTSINGQVLPTFTAESGKIERWRMIHGGVRNTINLEFRKLADGAPDLATYLKTGGIDGYKKEYCPSTNKTLPYHIIADDGLTRSAAWETTLTTLQPGYRNDALVVFPEAGSYCVVDALAPASESVTREEEKSQLLGFVNVNGIPEIPVPYIEDKEEYDIHSYLTKRLVAAVDKLFDATYDLSIPSMKVQIKNDLENGLKLTAFTPHPDVKDSEVNGYQELAFSIDFPNFQVSNKTVETSKPDDYKVYDHKRVDRTLTLGKVEEWTLQSKVAGHPFHIHVNPFQIVKILDPNGKDVSRPDVKDDFSGAIDPEYRGLKGVWKDTIWVKTVTEDVNGVKTELPYKIFIRTRYERYIGDFVLHCHILDHEDQGMMQNVSIVIPKAVGVKTASHS